MGRAFEYRRASKEKRWDKMSKLFPKLSKAITVAAKEGVADPELNGKLRAAIINARNQNMPKDNIDAAIKRATNKDAGEYIESTYEGKGPHGVLVFVECATDNNTRTVANIKSYFNRFSGQLLTNGSLEFMFSRKAVIEFEKKPNMNLEELEFELIDAGLESIEEHDGMVYVYGDFTAFGQLSKALENMHIEIKKGTLKRIPTSPMEFTDAQIEDIERLIDKIEDDDDVQMVYTNIA